MDRVSVGAERYFMDIKRIDHYNDPRFREKVLCQHGCFLVDGSPWEVEITGENSAVIRMSGPACGEDAISAVTEEFRFYAQHITVFSDENGNLLREFPPVKLFPVEITKIQPSQFYADADKLKAVETFIRDWKDIKLPLIRQGERYISCDGHTRLYLAVQKGFSHVQGFLTEENEYLFEFAEEARRRGVGEPKDIRLLPHGEYEVKWNKFCDDFFAAKEDSQ